MSLCLKLVSFREFKGWQPDVVATRLGLPCELYNDLEKGKVKIDDSLAEKLSMLYQVPKNMFVVEESASAMCAEVIYNGCTFTSGSHSSNGYINHQYNDRGIDEILFSKKEEVKLLKNIIDALQQQNLELFTLIKEKIADVP